MASAKCVFSFDDGHDDIYANALPIMQSNGLVGTAYIITDLIGDTGRLTQSQIFALQSAGWEIGSHTASHPDMTLLNEADARLEMSSSLAALEDLGLHCKTLGVPSRLWNSSLATWSEDYYSGVRSVHDAATIVQPLPVPDANYIDIGTPSYNSLSRTAADATGWIDQAISSGGLVILLFHHVRNDSDAYSASLSDFTTIAEYAAAKVSASQLDVITMAEVVGEALPQRKGEVYLQSAGEILTLPTYDMGEALVYGQSGGEYLDTVSLGSTADSGCRVTTSSGAMAVVKEL